MLSFHGKFSAENYSSYEENVYECIFYDEKYIFCYISAQTQKLCKLSKNC